MHVTREGQEGGPGGLPEVRAGLVLVKPKNGSSYDEASGGTRRWARRRTWVLPVMRAMALALSMLCLAPSKSMGTSLGMMDRWMGGPESDQHEYRTSHG